LRVGIRSFLFRFFSVFGTLPIHPPISRLRFTRGAFALYGPPEITGPPRHWRLVITPLTILALFYNGRFFSFSVFWRSPYQPTLVVIGLLALRWMWFFVVCLYLPDSLSWFALLRIALGANRIFHLFFWTFLGFQKVLRSLGPFIFF